MSASINHTDVRVLYADTDAGGVVYNANYLRYFEIGRGALMRDWVCSYRQIEEMGYYLPVTESWLRYKAPARYDDLITIETSVAELTHRLCTFAYRVVRAEEGLEKPRLLVKGYTVHVAVGLDGKLTSLPIEITSKLAAFINPNPPVRRFGIEK